MDFVEALNVAKDAGIALTAIIASVTIIVSLIRFLSVAGKSNNQQWTEITENLREQIEVQKQTNDAFQAFSDKLIDLPESMEKRLDRRFTTMENNLERLSRDVRRLLAIVGEDRAEG